MVKSCSALNCTNRTGKNKQSGITFHKFPLKEKERCNKWVAAVCRENWTPSRYSLLCSEHFEPKFYRQCNDQRFLKFNAVPTILKDSKTRDKMKLLRKQTAWNDHTYQALEFQPDIEPNETADENCISDPLKTYQLELFQHSSTDTILIKVENPSSPSDDGDCDSSTLNYLTLEQCAKNLTIPESWNVKVFKQRGMVSYFCAEAISTGPVELVKQLCLQSHAGKVKASAFVLNTSIPVELIGMNETVTGMDEIKSCISNFDSKNVCVGGPKSFDVKHVRTAYVDSQGIWRHNNCLLLIDEGCFGRCKFCNSLTIL